VKGLVVKKKKKNQDQNMKNHSEENKEHSSHSVLTNPNSSVPVFLSVTYEDSRYISEFR
jgi:hypothetical protein